MIGATTNNLGFWGNIPADAAKNYNLYMSGTAPNYMAGNLGIGTTTPSSYGLLAVSASISASTIKNMIAMQQSAGVDSATMRIAGYAYTGNARTAIDFVQNAATNFNSQMVFSTSAGADAVERMRIDSAGNVGIGTSSPTEKLDVAGNIALTGSVVFEGATADAFETTLSVTDPTADRTITLPNATGTVALTTNVRDNMMKFIMEVM